MWDSKYLVSIFPRRHCDHQCHNGNPDEDHMQLLSLNKISQFPLHPGTMGLSPGSWLSSYSPGAIIAAKPLLLTTLTHFTPLPSSACTSPCPIPSCLGKGRGFATSEIFSLSVHIPSSFLLLFSLHLHFFLYFPFFSFHPCYISSHTEERVRDTWFLWLLLIGSISGYF